MAIFDMQGYRRLWRDRRGRFVSKSQTAAELLAATAEKLSKAMLSKLVYSKPEDVSATGRKKWTRTGDLLANERADAGSTGEVILSNRLEYAEPRHEAGKPGRRNINPARIAHWRDDLQPALREEQISRYEAALLETLETV